jgi:hypothetical protein
MVCVLRQVSAHAGSALIWATWFSSAVVGVFVIYLGVAMVMAMRKTGDDVQASIRYWIFRDLLELFYRMFSGRDR